MIETIIKSYLQQRNKDKFFLFAKVFPYTDWANGLLLGNGMAVITNILLIGKITLIDNIVNNLFVLSSPAERVDYSNLFKFTEISGGLIQVESNFLSIHTTKLTVEFPAPQMFSSILKGSIQYYNITTP